MFIKVVCLDILKKMYYLCILHFIQVDIYSVTYYISNTIFVIMTKIYLSH